MEALEKEFEELISSEEDDFTLSKVEEVVVDDEEVSVDDKEVVSEDEEVVSEDEKTKDFDSIVVEAIAKLSVELQTPIDDIVFTINEDDELVWEVGSETGFLLEEEEELDEEELLEVKKKKRQTLAKIKAAAGGAASWMKKKKDRAKDYAKNKIAILRDAKKRRKKNKKKSFEYSSFEPYLDSDGKEIQLTNYDATTDVSALVSDTELSEEFKTKATTIFEAAVTRQVNVHVEHLKETYNQQVSDTVEAELDDTVNQVDAYLDYVVEEWMSDNSVAVENGIRHNIAENFMKQIKEVLISNYVEVPEAKVDVVDDLSEKVLDLETKLGAVLSDNIEMKAVISEHKKVEAIHQLSGNLTDVEVEKFKELSESIEYNGDQEEFTTKLSTIKDSYFGKATPTVVDSNIEDDSDFITESVSDVMSSYTSALSRTVKK